MQFKIGDKVNVLDFPYGASEIVSVENKYGRVVYKLKCDYDGGYFVSFEDKLELIPPTHKKNTDNEKEILWALCDMVNQFAFRTEFYGKTALANGGLSALETAFYTLYDNGLKLNSNGTIRVSNLHKFMDELKGGVIL